MNTYQKKLIKEHSELIVKINKLHNYIYGVESDNDCKIEFANKCIQLSAMKKYEEALRARMENAGIVFEEGNYFEKVANITPTIVPPVPIAGSDYDADVETKHQSNEK